MGGRAGMNCQERKESVFTIGRLKARFSFFASLSSFIYQTSINLQKMDSTSMIVTINTSFKLNSSWWRASIFMFCMWWTAEFVKVGRKPNLSKLSWLCGRNVWVISSSVAFSCQPSMLVRVLVYIPLSTFFDHDRTVFLGSAHRTDPSFPRMQNRCRAMLLWNQLLARKKKRIRIYLTSFSSTLRSLDALSESDLGSGRSSRERKAGRQWVRMMFYWSKVRRWTIWDSDRR